jgi:predicted NBD/HSP70 family sugar kinase
MMLIIHGVTIFFHDAVLFPLLISTVRPIMRDDEVYGNEEKVRESVYLGAIEAGGTKFVCAVSDRDGTAREVIGFFSRHELEAIALVVWAVDLNPDSGTYGYITSTPKPHWANFSLVGEIQKHFNVPVGFDTDANVAVIFRFRHEGFDHVVIFC